MMVLRQRFKLNKHRFNQRLIRWLLITGCLLLLAMNALFALTYIETRRVRNEFLMQRSMLDARAAVQTALIHAMERKGLLSPEEIAEIKANWTRAEYPERFKP